MRILRKLGLATALVTLSSGYGLAADIIEEPIPEVVPVVYGGWYLRGDIGMSNQHIDGLENELNSLPATLDWRNSGTFSSAPTYQVGVGYEFNEWFRVDGTVQYRGKADFDAFDRYDIEGDGVWDGANQYEAEKSEWLLMFNGYVDLGTYAGITPYVGAGIGASRNTISGYQDINTPNGGVAYAGSDPHWEFAWGLHAGLAMDITDRATLDFGYSYLDLGDARTDDVIAYDGTNTIDNPTTFKNITSHDLKFGLRYKLY
jgi:opacity protein-like surface antigen